MNSIKNLILVGVFFFQFSAFSQETVERLLEKGWREYDFRTFSSAERLFKKAEKIAETSEDYCQALTGQAFCYHYGKKANATANDYEYAIELYRKCLEKTHGNSRLTSFFNSMIAECSFRIYELNGSKNELKEAEKLWKDIQEKHSGTVVAQDSLLFEVVSQTADFTDESTVERSRKLENYTLPVLKTVSEKKISGNGIGEKMLLTPVMANYLHELYFWNKKYDKSLDWIMAYCELGPTSYSAKAEAYFKTARIAEIKLKNDRIARKYYSKFYNEIKNNRMRYFSREKARELNSR